MNRKERVQDELWDFMGLDLCRDVCLGGWLIGKRQWGKRVGGGTLGGGGRVNADEGQGTGFSPNKLAPRRRQDYNYTLKPKS